MHNNISSRQKKRQKDTHSQYKKKESFYSPGIPRMTAGRWEESLAAVFPRMSSILEAGDLPEDLGQDIPASGLGILRSSLGCLCSRRWVDRELCSSRVEGRDPGSLVEDPVQEVQGVQEVLLGMRGREELQGGRA